MSRNIKLNAVEKALLAAIKKDLADGNYDDVRREVDHLGPTILGSDFAYELVNVLLSAYESHTHVEVR